MLTRSSLAAILILITTSLFANQKVVTNSNDSGTGSLRKAIETANFNDTIVFSTTLSGYNVRLTSGQFKLDPQNYRSANKLTIIGLGANNTIIDGNGIYRHFELEENDTLILQGLTLKNGWSPYSPSFFVETFGGSIAVNDGKLVVTDCNFVNNKSQLYPLSSAPFESGGDGGAIFARNSTVTVTRCTFEQNMAIGSYNGPNYYSGSVGGAISSWNSNLHITDCLFELNQANLGGALYLISMDTVTIDGTRFQDNLATAIDDSSLYDQIIGYGGAIADRPHFAYSFNYHLLEIHNSTFSGNTATKGGAIYSEALGPTQDGAETLIYNSTFENNTANYSFHQQNGPITGDGGAMFVSLTSANISGKLCSIQFWESTLSGNKANGGDGGAVYVELINPYPSALDFQINHSTVTNNSALQKTFPGLWGDMGGTGGGINLLGNAFNSSMASISVDHTIIAGNSSRGTESADITNGTVISNGYNFIGSTNGLSNFTPNTGDHYSTAISGLNPLLHSLQNAGGITKVHLPYSGSPVIDAGDPTLIGLFDQRGYARPIGAAIDIGAVEYQGTAPTCNTTVASNGPASLCLGETAVFADNSTDATFSGWFLNGIQIGYSTDTFQYNFTQPGTYNLMQVAANGSCKDTTYKTVEVYDMPQLDILGTGLNSGLFGSSATLDADQGTPGMSYLWSTGDTTSTITVTATGTYSVTVIPANGFCPATQTVRVSISTPVPSPFTNLPTFPRGGTSTGPSVIPGPTAPPPPFHQRLMGAGDNEDDAWTFELYPNPATNAIMVSLAVTSSGVERTAQATFNLYTLTGQQVLSKTLTDAQTSIDLNLPGGSYLYRVTGPSGFIRTGKLIVIE